MHVVFVESFSKCSKIEHILNKNLKETYRVFATGGHIREMPVKELAVDVNNNYKASYVYNKKSTMQIRKKLKNMYISTIFLATDPDIEGERIAFDVYELLKKEHNVPFKRVKFNEITENAVIEAFKYAGDIDMNVVHAQTCRRVMDRLIGYKLTPYLWKNVDSRASAGRVLSVVVRMLYDREEEIRRHDYKTKTVVEGLFGHGAESIKCTCKNLANTELLQNNRYVITNVELKRISEAPGAPYTTAAICRDASTKLGLNAKMCMKLLQMLYQEGHITYIRTDSTKLSKSFKNVLLEFLKMHYNGYVKTRDFEDRGKNVQGAHEAIRPTNLMFNADVLPADQRRLYKLIWQRTVACFMVDSEREVQHITIKGEHDIVFEGSVSRLAFPGWRMVYNEKESGFFDYKKRLNKEIDYDTIEIIDKFAEPPKRYKDHTLIKRIESSGIGRPSTYAYFLEAIKDKKFADLQKSVLNSTKKQHVVKIKRAGVEDIMKNVEFRESNVLVLTEIGKLTMEYMIKNFESILDYDYTARLEHDVDDICNGNVKYQDVIDKLYNQLKKHLI